MNKQNTDGVAGGGSPVDVDIVEVADGANGVRARAVLEITLNRPERLNAVDLDMLTSLAEVLESVADPSGPEVAAVVIQGQGKTLSAGADLENVVSGGQDPTAIMAAASRVIVGVVDVPVPVICALTGKSAGFGVSLGLAADIAVMESSSQLVLSFVDVGLGVDGGVSYLLPSVVGRQVASRMLLSGERVTSGRALDYGLVAEVVEDGGAAERCRELARDISRRSVEAVRGIKAALIASDRAGLVEALSREASIQTPLLTSPELMAAATSFFDR
jgi:enoyl-CoA hydratase/carnithine racemase